MLRAVANGRCQLRPGREPVLIIDGLTCADSATVHRMIGAGLIVPPTGPATDRARLTPAGKALVDSAESPRFDVVLRGYNRVEVDQYVRGLLEENAALRRDLETARTARPDGASAPRPQASPTSRHYDVDTPVEDSFECRAEQLLHLAEQEAADVRTCAIRDAESVLAAARRKVEEQLRAAEAQAEDIRARARQEAASIRNQALPDAARLDGLYRSIKGELQRLAELLNAEAQRPDPEGGPAQADDSTSGTATNT